MKMAIHHKQYIAPIGLVGITILSGAILLSNKTHADDVVSTATITVPVACTMSGTGMDSHTATIPNGTAQENIGTTTMKVYCNDSEGFSIYAAGFSDDALGNTYLRDATLGASDDILTGTTFTGTSQWAMKIGATSGTYPSTIAGSEGDSERQTGDTDYSTWAEIPSSYTRIAHRNSGTDVNNESAASAEGSSITATYKAFINSTQKAGTYVGKVKFTMVHPASEEPLQPQPSTAGCINYFANASNAEGTMGCQSATDGNTVTLFASNFSRDGYGFAGWSDAYDYTTNANAHFYGPNEDITVPEGTTANGLSLYAVWVQSEGSLQDTSKVATLCGNGTGSLTPATYSDEDDEDASTWSITANLNSITALTDTRDNQTYAIAKLTDGNCWMIENLRLADTHQEGASTVNTTLTTANTNKPLNDNDATNPTVTLKHNYTDSTTFTNLSPTSSVAYNETSAPEGWCTTDSAACDNQSRLLTDNTANRAFYTPSQIMSSRNVNLYSYGNYYNWYSATAGNGTYGKSSGDTAGDLCPAGWHLPTGTGSGEFGLLSNSLGGYKNASNVAQYMDSSTTPTSTIMNKRIRHFPNNFVYSGGVLGASLNNRGSYGLYWSSTAGNSSYAYNLSLGSSSVYPGTYYYYYKYVGRTIRCVASGA